MENLNRLHDLLTDHLSSHGEDVQNLYYELVSAKPVLLALFDVPPRSAAEKAELQSGRAKIGGQTLSISHSFAVEALALSAQLDVSEAYCAELIEGIMRTDPNLTPQRRVEKAIHIYHSRRSTLVACLQLIVDGSAPSASEQNGEFLRGFATSELFGSGLSGFTHGWIGSKLLDEMEKVSAVEERLGSAILNAKTETNLQDGSIGRPVLQDRQRFLASERTSLCCLMYSAARHRFITPTDISKLVKWVAEHQAGEVSPYMVCAILSAIIPITGDDVEFMKRLLSDAETVKSISRQIANETQWKASRSKGTKAALQLGWALFGRSVLSAGLGQHRTFSEEAVEENLRHAIENDAFQYLIVLVARAESVGSVSNRDPLSYSYSLRQDIVELSDPQFSNMVEPVSEAFRPHVLECVKHVVVHLIGYAPSVLRSVRTRQEDLLGASSRNRGQIPGAKPRSDIAAFFVLLGALYSALPPDSAEIFWHPVDSPPMGNLSKFLRWAVDIHDGDMVRAMYEMVAGMCNGRGCAEMAYNFLSIAGGGGVDGGGGESLLSWRKLYRTLEDWNSKVSDPRIRQPHSQQQNQRHIQAQPSITAADVYYFASFLAVLRAIATHSPRARLSLFSQSSIRIVPSLIALIPCHIPLELKGIIFDTLAAFCIPGAGVPGVEICKEVWMHLEEAEVLGHRRQEIGVFANTSDMNAGVAFELDDVEIPARRFPSTLGFVRLLATLIHAPKAIPLSVRLLQFEPTRTIPDNFGSPERTPGVMPYLHFVIEKVLLPSINTTSPREYIDQRDKLAIVDASLAFLENCLASYTLDELLRHEEDFTAQGVHAIASRLLSHPGFGVLHEMLSDSPLVAGVLSYLQQGASFLERGDVSFSTSVSSSSASSTGFQLTMTRVMRILHRVLEIQDVFIDVLSPMITDFDTKPLIGVQFSSSAISGLDQRLVWNPDRVVSIALCAAHGSQDELVLMAIRTLSALSGSAPWAAMDQAPSGSNHCYVNRLAVALDRNADSEEILAAFVSRLNEDSIEEVTETDLNQACGAGAGLGECETPLAEALRWEILDLLLDNTDGSRPGPNFAHLLLGFSSGSSELTLEDPHAIGAQTSCLHIILELLGRGVPAISGSSDDWQRVPPLYQTNPVLAEKCYRLLDQLCTQDLTRETTMRYLRTRENFFVRQLTAMPSLVPTARYAGAAGVIHYADQSQVATTCETVAAFLRLRSYLLETVAQEVHLLTQSKQGTRINELIAILFGSDGAPALNHVNSEHKMGSTFSPGQSLSRVVELFYSFDFDWEEANSVESVDLVFYRSVDLTKSLRSDYAGCELVDRDVLMQMLQDVKAQLQSELGTSNALLQLERETSYILASCTVENHRREIQYAKGLGLDSWRRLLDVCMVKCFDHLSPDRRDAFLFDLLTALPKVISSSSVSTLASISLSETVVTLMTRLREDRNSLQALQYLDAEYTLPPDKMQSVLKGVLECVLDPRSSEFARGNLYAALINYLHMVDSSPRPSDTGLEQSSIGFDDSMSMDDSMSVVNEAKPHPRRARQSDAESYTLSILNIVVDKIVQVVSRDALNGSEVWKSVAFTLLDCLVRVSRSERPHRVLGALVKQGVLSTFVAGIRAIDSELEVIYSPDPSSLNALFVFEAKMALLIRIAQTRHGADRLIDSRCFSYLSQCEYLSAKPEIDNQSIFDQATFLPNALHRYHQLFLPTLQLTNSILASMGSASKQNMKQAIEFLMIHRETFVLALKDNSPETSLSGIREQQLMVSFCSYVLPSLERGQLGPADYGPLHAAVLTLGARSLSGRARRTVRPSDDAEALADSAPIETGERSITRFELMVDEAFEVMRNAIITYLASASNATGSELRIVLLPSSKRTDDDSHNALAMQPSLGDVVSTLNGMLDQLTSIILQIENASRKLSMPESVGAEDVTDILQASQNLPLSKLSPFQQRSVAFKEFERVRSEGTLRALRIIHMVEVLILLIWRHLDYFQSGRHIGEHLRESIALLGGSRLGSSQNISRPTGTQAVSTGALKPLIGQLERLNLPPAIFGKDVSSRESYIKVLCRKLKEAVTFGDDNQLLIDKDDGTLDLPPY